MFQFNRQQQASIAQTGFFSSLISYGVFWCLDLVRPGFVARFFSVHIFLIGIIVFGVWFGSVMEEYTDHARVQKCIAVGFGIVLCLLVWNLGSVLGGWRVIVSAIAIGVPFLLLQLIKFK